MSKENLNDFYNLNRFNQKLRERVDSYEPELSDSLWDRIEHGLNRKETRSKRAVWMVYVLGALLLLSSAGIFYLLDQNQQLAEAGRKAQEAGIVDPQLPKTAPSTGNELAIANTDGTTVSPVTPAESAAPVQVEMDYVAPEASTQGPEQITPGAEANGSIPEAGGEVEEITPLVPVAPIAIPEEVRPAVVEPVITGPTAIHGKAAPDFRLTKKADARFLELAYKKNKDIYPSVMPFIGLTSEVGSTRQRLSGPHAGSHAFEHPMQYTAQGVRFGVITRSGWSFSTGLAASNSGSNLWYGIGEATLKLDTFPTLDHGDSVIVGSNHAVMKQNWLDIPVQVGYMYSLNSKWSVTGNAGVTYSIINRYSGSEPDSTFASLVSYGTEERQPFQNYVSLQVGTGVAYQFARNWQISLEGQYRRGMTEINRIHSRNYPSRKADFIGGQIGLRYILR